MREYRLAAIPGDGIGPEVISAGLQVLDESAAVDGGFRLAVEHFDWNSENYLKRGHYIPEGGLERLRSFDAIFFGAVGSLEVADHVSLWGLRLPIAQGFDQYANVRPARLLPGVTSPLSNGADIDWVIIRENSEGEYAGHGGRAHRGLPIEVGTETAVFTRAGVDVEPLNRRPTGRETTGLHPVLYSANPTFVVGVGYSLAGVVTNRSTGKPIPAGPDHGPAKFMQPVPSRVITA